MSWAHVIEIDELRVGIFGDYPGGEIIGFFTQDNETVKFMHNNPDSVKKALEWMTSQDAKDFCIAQWATDWGWWEHIIDKMDNPTQALQSLVINKYTTDEVKNQAQELLKIRAKKEAKKLYLKDRRNEFQKNRNRLALVLIDRDGYYCQNCLLSEGLTIDHVIPLSRGGSDDPENLQFLCQSCNSKKGDKK